MNRNAALALVAAFALAMGAAAQTIDKPVATVKLTKQEVISFIAFKADVEKIQAAIGRALTLEERKQYLDSRINALLFFQYCDRERIYASDAEVNAAIAQAKASLGQGVDDAKLELALRSQGIFTDARTYFKQQLLFRSYLTTRRADDLKALQAPSSEEILKAYDLAKASLVRPDTARVSVIYVDLRGLAADAKAKAVDTMRQLAAQLKSNPAKFDELVIKSTDPGSGYKATPSIYISKVQQFQDLYGAVFMDRVFKVKVGEVSDLIENEAGLQVIRVNEFLPQKQLTLSDTVPGQQATVQDVLMQRLAGEKQAKLVDSIEKDLVAALRKEGSFKIFDANLNF